MGSSNATVNEPMDGSIATGSRRANRPFGRTRGRASGTLKKSYGTFKE